MFELTDDRRNELGEKVLKMSYTELRAALLIILSGCDVDYAIETISTPQKILYRRGG